MQSTGRAHVVRLQFAYAILCSLVGGICIVFRGDVAKATSLSEAVILTTGLGLAAAGFGMFLLLYLRGAINVPLLREDIAEPDLDRFRSEINSLTAGLDAKLAAAAARIEPLRSTNAAEEGEEPQRAEEKAMTVQMRRAIETTVARLRQEIAILTRRGNLNLVIGTLTTTLAVGLLVYMVLGAEVNFGNMTSLLSHYVPRIATVSFIEVFAFFFLKLYRSTLDEIKYYQNELTNIALQQVGIEAALLPGEQPHRITLTERLLSVDRNRIGGPLSSEPSLSPKEMAAVLEQIVKIVGEGLKGR